MALTVVLGFHLEIRIVAEICIEKFSELTMRCANGVFMELNRKVVVPAVFAFDAPQLCDLYRQLNDTRCGLDRRLLALPEGDQRREPLWQELEDTLQQMSDVVALLATTSSTQPEQIRCKASLLAMLLRSEGSNASGLSAEAAALTLSLADEVAGLSWQAVV